MRPRTGVQKVCTVCGAGYYVPPSRSASRFCGNGCRLTEFAATGRAPYNKGAGMAADDLLASRRANRKRWRETNRDAERAAHLERKKTPEGRIKSRMDAHTRRIKKVAAANGTVPACSPIPRDVTDRLYEMQGGLCFWTGDPLGDKFEVDHIVPISKGGAHSTDNLCLATVWANRSKSDLMPDVFWARLWDPAHVQL